MGEFADMMKQRAVEALRRTYGQEPSVGTEPFVELIGCLSGDGAGGVLPLAQTPLTTEQWIIWR